jgi:hypothetical protein
MEIPEVRIRKIEDVESERKRLKLQMNFQLEAAKKTIRGVQEELKPENLIVNAGNHLINKYFPGAKTIWDLSADLRKFYFLKFISKYFNKKRSVR